MPQTIVRGNTVTLDGFVRNASGDLADADSIPQVSILDPTGATIVNLDDATNVGTGHYQYEYDVAGDALVGGWAINWYATVAGDPLVDEDVFTVVAGIVTPSTGNALASVDDLEETLGRALTTAEAARAERLLESASNRVRRACGGQKISAESDVVVRRRVLEGHVKLPQKPVTAVSSVKLIDGTAVDFHWPGDQTVQVWLRSPETFFEGPWPDREWDRVDITYDHEYDGGIPEEVRDVVVNVVLRALGVDPTDGALTGETVEGYAYTQGSTGAAGPIGLLADEVEVLKPYGAGSKVGTLRIGV